MGVEKPIGFSTGREWDRETGLYYYRARYYDPMDGRFIAKDPIGFKGGDINLYEYTKNNPINLTDSFGLQWQPGQPGNWPSPYPALPPYLFPGGQPPGPSWYPPKPNNSDSARYQRCVAVCVGKVAASELGKHLACEVGNMKPVGPFLVGYGILEAGDCYVECYKEVYGVQGE